MHLTLSGVLNTEKHGILHHDANLIDIERSYFAHWLIEFEQLVRYPTSSIDERARKMEYYDEMFGWDISFGDGFYLDHNFLSPGLW